MGNGHLRLPNRLAAVVLCSMLSAISFQTTANADTYSLPYPVCNAKSVEFSATPGEATSGIVSIALGGGDANSAGCDGYSGAVALSSSGGSATAQTVAVALGYGSASSTNSGVAVAPFGYASAGAVKFGCYTNTDGGIWVQWCGPLQTVLDALPNPAGDTLVGESDWSAWNAIQGEALYGEQNLQVPLGTTVANSGCRGRTAQQVNIAGTAFGAASTTCYRNFKRLFVDTRMTRDRWYGEQKLDENFDVEPNSSGVDTSTEYDCAGKGRYTYNNYSRHEAIDYDNTHYVAATVNKNRFDC